MKANELRIGNYLEIDQYPNDRVIVQIENGNAIDQCLKLNPKPIPLTEEFFELCGFEKDNRVNWRLKSGYYWIEVNRYSVYINGQQVVLIDYVHQLQNIWFALTGKELTYEG